VGSIPSPAVTDGGRANQRHESDAPEIVANEMVDITTSRSLMNKTKPELARQVLDLLGEIPRCAAARRQGHRRAPTPTPGTAPLVVVS
jgi:hypothetical protein